MTGKTSQGTEMSDIEIGTTVIRIGTNAIGIGMNVIKIEIGGKR